VAWLIVRMARPRAQSSFAELRPWSLLPLPLPPLQTRFLLPQK